MAGASTSMTGGVAVWSPPSMTGRRPPRQKRRISSRALARRSRGVPSPSSQSPRSQMARSSRSRSRAGRDQLQQVVVGEQRDRCQGATRALDPVLDGSHLHLGDAPAAGPEGFLEHLHDHPLGLLPGGLVVELHDDPVLGGIARGRPPAAGARRPPDGRERLARARPSPSPRSPNAHYFLAMPFRWSYIERNSARKFFEQRTREGRRERVQALGRHLLLELFDCDAEAINSLEVVKASMVEAARLAQATIVDVVFHEFNPFGISGVVVIAESHLAIHTWPEYRYAAVDIFSHRKSV